MLRAHARTPCAFCRLSDSYAPVATVIPQTGSTACFVALSMSLPSNSDCAERIEDDECERRRCPDGKRTKSIHGVTSSHALCVQ